MLEIYADFSLKNPIPCIASFITLLPLVLMIAKKAYLDTTFKLLFYYLIFKLIVDGMMFHSASLQKNNLVLYNISIPIFYALLSGMFYSKLNKPVFKKLLVFSIVGFTAFVTWDFVYSNPNISDMHNHRAVIFSKTVEGALMIALILFYFYETIKSLQIPNLLTFPFFWVCSGLLLYYSSVIFIAPVLHYTATWNNIVDLGITPLIPNIFEIICALLFSVAIYYIPKDTYAKQ